MEHGNNLQPAHYVVRNICTLFTFTIVFAFTFRSIFTIIFKIKFAFIFTCTFTLLPVIVYHSFTFTIIFIFIFAFKFTFTFTLLPVLVHHSFEFTIIFEFTFIFTFMVTSHLHYITEAAISSLDLLQSGTGPRPGPRHRPHPSSLKVKATH